MEEFKSANFLQDHPNKEFPKFETLSDVERDEFLRKVRDLVGLPSYVPTEEIAPKLIERSTYLGVLDIEPDEYNIEPWLKRVSSQSDEFVYLNCGNFLEIDCIRCDDLATFFEYIWYPTAEDIEVYSSDIKKALIITHYGELRIIEAPGLHVPG